MSEYLYAVKPAGKVRWSVNLGPLGTQQATSPLLGEDGTVYTTSSSGYFYTITPKGRIKWKVATGGAYDLGWNYPVMSNDGIIYVASQRGTSGVAEPGLRAISQTGQMLWYYAEPAIGTSISDDGTVYAVIGSYSSCRLVAFTSTGVKKWEVPIIGIAGGSPVVYPDGTIIIAHSSGGAPGYVSAYTPEGILKWQVTLEGESNFYESKPFIGPPLSWIEPDGLIFVLGRYTVYALDKSGNIVLKKQHECFNGTGLVDGSYNMYFATDLTHAIVSMATGVTLSPGIVLWQTRLSPWIGSMRIYPSAPAIGIDGTIYHITWDGWLYAIAPQSP